MPLSSPFWFSGTKMASNLKIFTPFRKTVRLEGIDDHLHGRVTIQSSNVSTRWDKQDAFFCQYEGPRPYHSGSISSDSRSVRVDAHRLPTIFLFWLSVANFLYWAYVCGASIHGTYHGLDTAVDNLVRVVGKTIWSLTIAGDILQMLPQAGGTVTPQLYFG